MISDRAPAGGMSDRFSSAKQHHRCLCCNGVIASVSEQDAAIGLSPALGLVSDECAYICNDCTAKLIEAAAAPKVTAGRRR
jgi:uncharacterized protein with PIN domain